MITCNKSFDGISCTDLINMINTITLSSQTNVTGILIISYFHILNITKFELNDNVGQGVGHFLCKIP